VQRTFVAITAGLALAACAGRDPLPSDTARPQDAFSDCTTIRAEIEANNKKAQDLAAEQGYKEVVAQEARQEYLTHLARERCGPSGYRPTPVPSPVYVTQ
jgi:hypothetical protein